MLNRIVRRVGSAYVRHVTRTQADRQSFRRSNERPVEYSFTFSWLNRLQPRTVLDVGTGQSALPALIRTCGFVVTAVDNVRDYWPSGMINRHWQVEDRDIRLAKADTQYDVVLCISVLEHIRETLAAMRGLHAYTRPGGHLILTTPFAAHSHPNVYEAGGSYGSGNPYPCRQHSPSDLADWLACGFTLVHEEYWRAFDSDTWSVGELVRPLVLTAEPAHLGCFVLRRID
jgi:SAM-dependent methyltransferase